MRFGVLWFAGVIAAQDFSGLQVEKASGGHRFIEGAVWSKSVNGLLFCDVAGNIVHVFLPGKGLAKYREGLGGASAIAIDNEGRMAVAESKDRRVVRIYPGDDKKLDVLAERFEGKRLNGPNDITIRKDGHIYFTDPAFGHQTERRELDFSGVYHLTPKGELSLVAKPKGRPNGIAVSANGKTLYVANSDERRVYAYDLDGRGSATNERVMIDKIEGVPDGIRLDEKGNLYVAAKNVLIYSPKGGLIFTLHMGEKPSSMAFGDEDHMTLFVTAKTSLYRARMKVKGVPSESSQ